VDHQRDWAYLMSGSFQALFGYGAAFSPSSLFSGNKGGYWDVAQSHVWSDNGTTQITDGGSVYRVDDLSGNGNHWLQTTSGQRPTWHANSGTPYIQFDGSDDSLGLTLPANITGTDVTGAWAGRYDTGTPAFARYLNIGTVGTFSYNNLSSMLFGYSDSGVTKTLYDNVAGPTNTPGADTDVVYISALDATNIYLKTDGGSDSSSAHGLSPSLNSAEIVFGCDVLAAGTNPLLGRLYAALVIDRTLTGTEKTNLATWLGAKQGRNI